MMTMPFSGFECASASCVAGSVIASKHAPDGGSFRRECRPYLQCGVYGRAIKEWQAALPIAWCEVVRIVRIWCVCRSRLAT